MFQAPVHFLVIPRKPIAMLDEVGGTFINIKYLIKVPHSWFRIRIHLIRIRIRNPAHV